MIVMIKQEYNDHLQIYLYVNVIFPLLGTGWVGGKINLAGSQGQASSDPREHNVMCNYKLLI
jgi:hypothetical protein